MNGLREALLLLKGELDRVRGLKPLRIVYDVPVFGELREEVRDG